MPRFFSTLGFVANLESFFLVSDDPWVPANDTHDGQSGAGYDWPEGSEDQDGVAQSDDGWYYTPVNSLMRLFAKYNGCASEAWTDPEMTELGWARRETRWDENSNLFCVSTEDGACNGPGLGARLMRCRCVTQWGLGGAA